MGCRDFLKQSAMAAALFRRSGRADLPWVEKTSHAGDHPKRVIIVGRGGGTVGAYELTQANHDVVVLEARTRPVARINAARSVPGRLYVEAGAARIPIIITSLVSMSSTSAYTRSIRASRPGARVPRAWQADRGNISPRRDWPYDDGRGTRARPRWHATEVHLVPAG